MNKLPNEMTITTIDSGFKMSDELAERFVDEVNEYLADKYGHLNHGWYYGIEISDILWEKE